MGTKTTEIKKILLMESGAIFYVKDLERDYHSQYGFISKEDLAKKHGTTVTTNTGKTMALLDPGFMDLYKKIRRAPQIVPRKDIGLIIAETGVGKNSKVLDAGSGSGALCCFMANIVKKVTTYEIRADFYEIAKSNIEFLGLKNVIIKNKSIYEPVAEKDMDLITLDVPEPWLALPNVAGCAKIGGYIVSYSPTIPQVIDFTTAVRNDKRLLYIDTVEILQRNWDNEGRKVRPQSISIGHSGFMTFVRRVS